MDPNDLRTWNKRLADIQTISYPTLKDCRLINMQRDLEEVYSIPQGNKEVFRIERPIVMGIYDRVISIQQDRLKAYKHLIQTKK